MIHGIVSAFRRFAGIAGAKPVVFFPVVVYLIALSGFVGDSYSRFDFPLDDAWIHRVYSRSIAFGHGFEYNEGKEEAGSTSPLWAIVTAPAHWLEAAGVDTVVVAVKLIGVLLGLAVLLATNRVVRRVSGSELAGCVGASLFALEPRFLFSSVSGMENILLLALWACGCAALLGGRFLLSVILFSLTPVTRPEAIVILPLCLPGLIQVSRTRGRSLATVGGWLIPVVPVLLWAAFCKSTTGHFLPNTYYLKARPFQFGVDEVTLVWRSLFLNGLTPPWAYIPGVAACAVACFMGARKVWPFLLLVAAPLVYLCGVVGTRDIFLEGYYWTRWLDPACIMLMIPFCVGCAVILSGGLRRRAEGSEGRRLVGPGRRVRLFVGMVGVACLAAAVPSYRNSWADRRHHLSSDSRAIHILNVQTGEWIREHTPGASVVAVNDAGAIRYFGRRRTIRPHGVEQRGDRLSQDRRAADGRGRRLARHFSGLVPGVCHHGRHTDRLRAARGDTRSDEGVHRLQQPRTDCRRDLRAEGSRTKYIECSIGCATDMWCWTLNGGSVGVRGAAFPTEEV